MVRTKTTIHTQKSYERLIKLREPNAYKILLPLVDSSFDQLLEIVTAMREKQSPAVSVYPLRYAV